MRLIAHLSDLHFGRVDPGACRSLNAALAAVKPDLVVVSGDLTQRARRSEFRRARAFLDELPAPVLVVPGNHDVPLWNPLRRFLDPLGRYRRLVTPDLAPFHCDDQVAVLGVNTARSLTVKDGRISRQQIERAEATLAGVPADRIRVVVTHHPFEGRSALDQSDVVGRASQAMAAFAGSQVDMILSGHLHASRIDPSGARYRIAGYSALLVQAGTALSTRRRAEANAFNLIRIDAGRIGIECRRWQRNEGGFAPAPTLWYARGSTGWAPVDGAPVPEVVQAGDAVVLHGADQSRKAGTGGRDSR
jgi:3',5'-cyclic AMP phosphodiesterase CpdA